MDVEKRVKRNETKRSSTEKHKGNCSKSTASSDSDSYSRRKRKKGKEKKKKRERSSSSSSSSESENEKKRRKLKRKQRKEAKRLLKKETKRKLKTQENDDKEDGETTDIPIALMEKCKGMAPMTKDEWEKKQSVIRKVYDEQTGRHRLIKGDGEVIEEIVSRERHSAINQQATKGDAECFQAHLTANMSKR